MKKILSLFSVITLGTTMATPILATLANNITHKNSANNNTDTSYKSYQPQSEWFEYVKTNKDLQNTILEIIGKEDQGYTFDKIDMVLDKVENQPIGTLLMNGEIKTTSGSPIIVSKHIIDNCQGENPIKVSYDSNQIETSTTINASISTSLTVSTTAEAKMAIPFASASVKTTLEFNLSASLSTSKTVTSTVTFDKFSTDIAAGKITQVDYIVIQNINVFNMALKAKADFVFHYRAGSKQLEIRLSQLSKYTLYREVLANYLYIKNEHKKYDKGFIEITSILNDPFLPTYDLDSTYVFIPLTFTVDGYSTLIKQSKL